jgi:hypothetical protein
MNRLLLLSLLAASACSLRAAEPRPDPNCITLPTFVFERRHAITAGVAFLLQENGRRYLVTAYHVLGPPGGLKAKILPRDVPREVKGIAGLCLGDSETILLGAPLLLVEDAKQFDADGADRDMVFALVKSPAPPAALALSKTTPAVGARVWLFARLLDRDRPTPYPAQVTEASPAVLQYRMEDPSLNLRALSGAPVLAEDGTVVVHLGFGRKEESLIGAAAPAAAIRERLATAAKPLDSE